MWHQIDYQRWAYASEFGWIKAEIEQVGSWIDTMGRNIDETGPGIFILTVTNVPSVSEKFISLKAAKDRFERSL